MMPNFHDRVLHVKKTEKKFSGDFRKAHMILSVEHFSRIPLEVKFTYKSLVFAKIA